MAFILRISDENDTPANVIQITAVIHPGSRKFWLRGGRGAANPLNLIRLTPAEEV